MNTKTVDDKASVALRQQAFSKLKKNIDTIAEKYFVDFNIDRRSYREISHIHGKEVSYWKLLMGAFSYMGNKNILLCGNPGSGKTTYTSLLSCMFSGLQFDLFDALKIQCHPDQTKDTMLARADLGRLAEEGVVWQASVYLPAISLDEINRLSPGKQAIIMEYIRTGMVEHLSKAFFRGKIPVFATMNENGAGTYPLPPPSLDRFDISLPFDLPVAAWEDNIQEASERLELELTDRNTTSEVITALLNKDKTLDLKLQYLAAKSTEGAIRLKKLGIEILTPAETNAMLSLPPMAVDAIHFYRSMIEEFNTSLVSGTLPDIETPNDKDKAFASGKVKKGLSHRALSAIKFYSGMLAGYLGSKNIGIEHILAVAPYCISHKVQFFMDYEGKFATSRLFGERKEIDLSRHVLGETKANYDNVANDLRLLTLYVEDDEGKISPQNKEAVKKVISRPTPEHSYLRHLYVESRKKMGLPQIASAVNTPTSKAP